MQEIPPKLTARPGNCLTATGGGRSTKKSAQQLATSGVRVLHLAGKLSAPVIWLTDLLQQDSVGHSILVIGVAIAVGLALGQLKAFGVSLGVGGVLFAGLTCAHFGLRVNSHVLDFTRELGLVFFVFTIGLQVGPGFFAALKRQGLALNVMAAVVVLLGALLAWLAHSLAGVAMPAAIGLFSGATTNTPSLGAVLEALKSAGVTDPARQSLPGIGYAVAYPFGIVGIILV
ncbi:MAG: hypothetical protein ABIR80_21920, partial [Opitutaceae bacterium]